MRCPICEKELKIVINNLHSKSYVCLNKHCFDISKYDYVNLLPFNSNSGDNKAMVDSRNSVMEDAYFLPLGIKIKEIIDSLNVKSVLDLGCGEGYYDRIINDDNKYVLYGLDISKQAIIKASKLSKGKAKYLIANIFKLPFFDNEFDLILNCFAPLEINEFHRVCKEYFIKVVPNRNHLIELKEQLYDKIKETVVDEVELDGFDLIFEENLKYKKYVYKINELFMMTPYYYTTHNNFDINLKECEVSFDFLIRLYKKRK